MLSKPFVVAVDGPAASGKGTLAKRLAAHFGMAYLDTGRLYRAVGKYLLDSGVNVVSTSLEQLKEKAEKSALALDIEAMQALNLSGEDIGQAASIVSAIPEVRAALLDVQRNVAKDKRGAVLDGRDIGTVVCPDAKYKFFITASLDARAERRFKELQKQDESVIYAAVLEELKARDARDQKRNISPLVPATGAIRIDTTGLGMDAVFDRVCSLILVD